MTAQYLNADEGEGCDHCPYAPPIVYVESRRYTVALCHLCAKIATGWTTEQMEMATRPFADQLGDALAKAYEDQLAR